METGTSKWWGSGRGGSDSIKYENGYNFNDDIDIPTMLQGWESHCGGKEMETSKILWHPWTS